MEEKKRLKWPVNDLKRDENHCRYDDILYVTPQNDEKRYPLYSKRTVR
jgi:hypothetical protein